MLAEDHMAIFTDEETGEVLAVNYVLDRTEQHRLKQYEKELEQKNRQLEAMLETEKKYSSKLYHDALTGRLTAAIMKKWYIILAEQPELP